MGRVVPVEVVGEVPRVGGAGGVVLPGPGPRHLGLDRGPGRGGHLGVQPAGGGGLGGGGGGRGGGGGVLEEEGGVLGLEPRLGAGVEVLHRPVVRRVGARLVMIIHYTRQTLINNGVKY